MTLSVELRDGMDDDSYKAAIEGSLGRKRIAGVHVRVSRKRRVTPTVDEITRLAGEVASTETDEEVTEE